MWPSPKFRSRSIVRIFDTKSSVCHPPVLLLFNDELRFYLELWRPLIATSILEMEYSAGKLAGGFDAFSNFNYSACPCPHYPI